MSRAGNSFSRDLAGINRAFTLVELLVSMAVLALIVAVAAGLTTAIQGVWTTTSARAEQFRSARHALERISSRISQATLNPYWVVKLDGQGFPKRYERQSDLRFLAGPAKGGPSPVLPSLAQAGSAVFFQAPTGFSSQTAARLDAALNTWGYFVEYGSDASFRPPFLTLPEKHRFRLMEFIDPSNELKVFQVTSGNPAYTGRDWYAVPVSDASKRRVLAENIVALVVRPRLPAAEDPTGVALVDPDNSGSYLPYDSTGTHANPKLNPRHQLPPIVDVAVVAIDERSAKRIEWGATPPDFGTASLFLDPSKMDEDLEKLCANIRALGLTARSFRASVPIAAARWSTEQTN